MRAQESVFGIRVNQQRPSPRPTPGRLPFAAIGSHSKRSEVSSPVSASAPMCSFIDLGSWIPTKASAARRGTTCRASTRSSVRQNACSERSEESTSPAGFVRSAANEDMRLKAKQLAIPSGQESITAREAGVRAPLTADYAQIRPQDARSQPGRCSSKAVMASSCCNVKPTASRPLSSRCWTVASTANDAVNPWSSWTVAFAKSTDMR